MIVRQKAVTVGESATSELPEGVTPLKIPPLFELARKNLADLSAQERQRLLNLSALQHNLQDLLSCNLTRSLEAFARYLPEVARRFEHYRPQRELEFFCTENGVPNVLLRESGEIFYKCDDPLAYCRAQVNEALTKQPLGLRGVRSSRDHLGQLHSRYINESVRILRQAQRRRLKQEGAPPSSNPASHTASNALPALSPLQCRSVPHVIILGVGLGYPLGFLLEQVEAANLTLIEPDADLFYASLQAYDWASLLEHLHQNNFGVNLLVGQSESQIFTDLSAFFSHHGRFLSALWWTLVHYQSEAIAALALQLRQDYHRLSSSLGFADDHLFGISHACRALQSGKNFVKKEVALPPEFAGTPLFVVGSGPSLERDLPFLRRHQDEAVIMACGTALEILYNQGIKPDFYAATERVPEIAQTIEAIPDRDFIASLILIAGDVIHPKVQRLFKHTALLGKMDEPFYWLMQIHPQGQLIRPVSVMNPLVGNLGVAAAWALGFKEVYLFGLDCGRRTGESIHAKSSGLYRQGGIADTQEAFRTTSHRAGNFGGLCESNFVFELSLRYLELVIEQARKEGFNFYNCSDGCLIAGAQPIRSEVLAALWPPHTPQSHPGLGADFDVVSNAPDKERLHDFIATKMTFSPRVSTEELTALCRREEVLALLDKLTELIWEPYKSRTECIQRLEQVSEYLSSLSAHPQLRFCALLLDGSLQSFFIVATHALYHTENERSCLKVTARILQRLQYFLSDLKAAYALVPDYVLGEHQALWQGLVGADHTGSKAPRMPRMQDFSRRRFKEKPKFEKITTA
ncbi:MAG: DUF115 domain-containing protein [Succinivibrio sp.]|nr:DUF115 domain-containing protein [Succinivibrio sp.]